MYQLIRWISMSAIACVMAYYGLISQDPLPDHRLIVGINDIVWHMGAFAALAAAVLIGRRRLLLPITCLLALAILMEAAQYFEPGHEVSMRDLLSGIAGIAIGALIALAVGALHGQVRKSGIGH